MLIKLLNKITEKSGYRVKKIKDQAGRAQSRFEEPSVYDQDSLHTSHNHDFMKDPEFIGAYNRGLSACDENHILIKGGKKHQIHWRLHVAIWAAQQAKNLSGDFVECGVDRGFLSSAIMKALNWNSLNRNFYLFDTFCGIDTELLSAKERQMGRAQFSEETYSECYDQAVSNFQEFKNVKLIRGSIPATLTIPDIDHVAYLSIDMNCARPEIAAAEFFWPKMVTGGVMLLDDYAYVGYSTQKAAFDEFAHRRNFKILSLPTGQGLCIKQERTC
jgi:hypothetical protein